MVRLKIHNDSAAASLNLAFQKASWKLQSLELISMFAKSAYANTALKLEIGD